MKWNEITNNEDLAAAVLNSSIKFVVLFKHSTRCSISFMAKGRLEGKWEQNAHLEPYILDLLRFREISDKIALQFDVEHKSPQILLIKNKQCIYSSSHNEIDYQKINDQFNLR